MIHFHVNILAEVRCVGCDRVHELVCYQLADEVAALEREAGFLFAQKGEMGYVTMEACPCCVRYEPTGVPANGPTAPEGGN